MLLFNACYFLTTKNVTLLVGLGLGCLVGRINKVIKMYPYNNKKLELKM